MAVAIQFQKYCQNRADHYKSLFTTAHAQKFLLCRSGQAVLLQCSNHKVFHEDQKRCVSDSSRPKRQVVWPNYSRGPSHVPWIFHGEHSRQFYPYYPGPLCLTNNPNCTFFYRCRSGFGIFSNCQNRTQFEVVIGSCFHAQIIGCNQYNGYGSISRLVPSFLVPLLVKQQTMSTAAPETITIRKMPTIPTIPTMP